MYMSEFLIFVGLPILTFIIGYVIGANVQNAKHERILKDIGQKLEAEQK